MKNINKLNTSSKFPTTIIVKGANILGVEIARSLLEQGGYVILIDSESNASRKILEPLAQYKNLLVTDFGIITMLQDSLRRLDYIFYFEHKSTELDEKISTQAFLQNSNYLDSLLDLTAKFDAKFLLTTSIKAHQLNISNIHMDYNYGFKNKSRHTQYMQLELQRYAESLVTEYQEKVGINGRILRMGEVIGRGMDFDRGSKLLSLIKSGLQQNDLVITGDGLEASYYVHFLDAAFGVLKAQFSASSKERIFTLANPEEISTLSIAYKLLELLPGAREIKFDSSDDGYPPLVLYKPAEGLTEIGWKPRIDFDRALIQTIEYVQELLIIEDALKKDNSLDLSDKKKVSDKIKDFFFVAENETKETDAIAKLIAERKKLELSRTGSIVGANSMANAQKKNKPKLSALQKVDAFLHDLIFGFSKRITLLKNVTVMDFIVTSALLFSFILIYFLLISPVFTLGRNIIMSRIYLERVGSDVANYNFESARENNEKFSSNVNSAQKRIDNLEYLFNITGRNELYGSTQRFLGSTIEVSQAYDDLFGAYIPLQNFFEGFKPNLTYRYGDNRIISADDQSDIASIVDEISLQKGKVEDSINRIDKFINEFQTYEDALPQQLVGNLIEERKNLEEKISSTKFLSDNYKFLPILLGKDAPLNYLVVVQDNSIYSMSGGKIAGFVSFTMEKGKISNLRAEAISTNELTQEIVTDTVISEINLVSSKDVNRENLKFTDLNTLSDSDLFLETIANYYEKTNEIKVDLVVATNLNTLSKYIERTGDLELQQINFSENNLLSGINIITGEDSSTKRNEAIMNLYGNSLADIFNSLNLRVNEFADIFAGSKANKDILLYSRNQNLEAMIKSVSGPLTVASSNIKFGMNSDIEDYKSPVRLPINTITGNIEVSADYSTVHSWSLSLNSSDQLQNATFCVSGGAKDAENFNVEPELVSVTFSTDYLCNIFLQNENRNYGLKFNTIPFASSEQGQTVYVLKLSKSPGTESNFDISFTFDSGLQIVPDDTSFIREGSKYVYSGVLTGDRYLKFEITKL